MPAMSSATHCDCASNSNVYVHAEGAAHSIYLRDSAITGCSGSGMCAVSGANDCGGALCCK